ncbi:MAG: histidine triad nucleotide-binding protein [Bdellovibrionales bacterium]|nr:histidine triad nucleotide-binding protein [Bdellovibrionales bacterium]
MTESTVFHKILAGEIPSERVHEDSRCIVIRDINPQAPVHLLCIPKEYIRDISVVTESQESILGHLLLVASSVAANEGLVAGGFRVVVNCGEDGGMEVPYLHLHILGGKKLPSLG